MQVDTLQTTDRKQLRHNTLWNRAFLYSLIYLLPDNSSCSEFCK